MPKISVGRDEEDREEHGLKGTGVIGKHLVGENQEAHKANPLHFDMARPHVMGVFGKRGTGKCLLPDEEVLTEKGLVEIEELFREASKGGNAEINETGEQLYQFDGPTVQSVSENFEVSENQAIAAYRKKVDEKLYRIKTGSGREVTVTGEHPLLTVEGWKCSDDLDESDRIAIPRKLQMEFEDSELETPASLEKSSYSNLKHRESELLDKGHGKISDLSDGSGSFRRMLKSAERKQLVEINGRTVSVTEKGSQELEERITDEHYRMSSSSKPIKVPEKVSPELGEFLSLLIAEGHEQKINSNNYRIIFVNKNDRLRERFIELGNDLFDLEFSRMDELTVYTNSKGLEQFLEANDYETGQNSFNKSIPDFVLTASDETVSRFLRTYFDCEGNLNRKQVEVTTASKDIANALSHMLLRFGIVARITEKEKYAANTEEQKVRIYQTLTISGKRQVERFREEIGFSIEEKSAGIEEYDREHNTNVDTVPCSDLIQEVREYMGADRTQISKHKQSLKAYEDGKYSPSREKLSEISSNLENFLEEIEDLKEQLETSPSVEKVEEFVDKSDVLWKEVNEELGYSRTDKKLLTYRKYSDEPEKLAEPVLELFEGSHSIEEARDKLEEISSLAESSIFWDEVEEIEKIDYEGWVYDLTVEGDHSFTGGLGGIFCHNSYSMGTIIEEIQSSDISQNLSTIVVDPMGIYWSMTRPNDRSPALLDEWDLKPEPFDAKVYIPEGKTKEFEEREMPYDDTFTLNPAEFTANEWAMAFNIGMNSEHGILLERVISKLQDDYGTNYTIDHIIKGVRKLDFPEEVQEGLVNRFQATKDWGVFGEESSLEKFTQRGELSIIDMSVFGEMASGWSVRSLVVGLLAKRILRRRMTARRIEEINEMQNISENEMPITWMFIDEAHEFLPAEGETPATNPLLRWVKIGREPGVSLVLATQQPAKLHPNALSQCDVLLSHKLTAKQDIDALGEIMQTYMRHDIQHYIDALPDRTGAGLILDDNSERIYPVQMRPRKSWHAGGTPDAFD